MYFWFYLLDFLTTCIDFSRRESFELSDLEAEMTRVESFQAGFERKVSGTPALAATLTGKAVVRAGEKIGKAVRVTDKKCVL